MNADASEVEGELGLGLDDTEVAGESNTKTGADGRPVEAGNDGAVECAKREEAVVEGSHGDVVLFLGGDEALTEEGGVTTRGEEAVGASDNGCLDRVVFAKAGNDVLEFFTHSDGHGIARGGVREGDCGDITGGILGLKRINGAAHEAREGALSTAEHVVFFFTMMISIS